MRLCVIAMTMLALCSCRDDPAPGTTPIGAPRPWLHRKDTMFTTVPVPTPQTLDQARRMDAIERAMHDGLNDQAQQLLDAFFANGNDHPRAQFLQGTLLTMRGDWTGATLWFQRAVARSPRWIEPRIQLAQAYYRSDHLADAEQVFGEIDQLAPHHPVGPYGQGLLALTRGNRDRARALIDTALSRDHDHAPSVSVRAEIARLDRDQALERDLLEHLAVIDPDDAQAPLRLGAIAEADGKRRDAERYYRTSYDLEPAPETARRLAQLASQRGDTAETRRWQLRAGVVPNPGETPATRP